VGGGGGAAEKSDTRAFIVLTWVCNVPLERTQESWQSRVKENDYTVTNKEIERVGPRAVGGPGTPSRHINTW
jgi:hypothetical protein